MKRNLSLIALLLLLTSCFKTAEEIKREKAIDQQLEQSSRIIADLTTQITELKGGLATTSGQIEEIDHKSKQSNEKKYTSLEQNIAQLNAQVKVLNEENTSHQKQLSFLSKEVKAQKSFIKNITGTLTKLNTGGSKKSKQSLIKKAHKAFEKNQKKKAKNLYQEVLASSKISNAQKNHVYFNLGLLNYWGKKYDQALIYFSKIYTKYPKSSFSPRALLYIARSFSKTGKSEEANATYQEVISKYPKSRQATAAKKEIK